MCAFIWPEERGTACAFGLPGGLLLAAGASGWFRLRHNSHHELTLPDGGIIVLLAWVGTSLAAAVPFMFAPTALSFSHAVFESVSGLTTTGLTLVDVTHASHAILLWRSILQLVGGAGLAIMMVAALIGPSGPAVSAAEGRAEQLVPHVRRSARLVLALYTGYVVLGITGYSLAGLTPFDAVAHTFTAVATGGFATHVESIGYWDSSAVEGVTIALMILGNLNFVTAWLLVSGNPGAFCRNSEVRLLVALILGASAGLFLLTTNGAYPGFATACRTAVFESISALTGTGFTTVDYAGWNPPGFLVLTVLMLVGGGACSTSGALKQVRVCVLVKSVYWEIRRALLPQRAVQPRTLWEGHGRSEITDARFYAITAYSSLYIGFWIAGALLLTAHGYGIGESLFEYASALGTVGLSTGITCPDAPLAVIWAETVAMFLGRLEFFVVFVSVVKLARDLVRMLRHTPE
ncbi:MAG: TrkH family potassium uptake protein [Candidatus Hydrogenedentes bacterium]|nr:TrkH family potassium uptake protein [Candidatus Hydrogenedentota bacterium]